MIQVRGKLELKDMILQDPQGRWWNLVTKDEDGKDIILSTIDTISAWDMLDTVDNILKRGYAGLDGEAYEGYNPHAIQIILLGEDYVFSDILDDWDGTLDEFENKFEEVRRWKRIAARKL
jgi:hypothetical protein